MKRKLPIGIQTFRRLRERGCYYVDKTAYAKRLVDEGARYCLSRPRRFGKSLFLDTLKELFEGSEPLFRGLAIHDQWDWSVRHPVLRLSFGGNYAAPDDLHDDAMEQLRDIESDVSESSGYDTARGCLRHLIRALHRRTGLGVVVLVDEYDKPILDAVGAPDIARANRELPARAVRNRQGLRCGGRVRLPHRRQQVLEGGTLLRPEQSHRPHRGSRLLGRLRLHRRGARHRLRAGAPRPRPRRDPSLVQRLQLAGAGKRVQPLRHPPALPQPPVRRPLVRGPAHRRS